MAAGPEDHPDVQVFDEIRLIEHLVRTTISTRLPAGLNYPQFEVLNLLSRRGDGITPAQISSALQMTKSGLTNTLQRLEEAGLIGVEDCAEDGRRKRVRLSGEGRRLYGEAMRALRPKMDTLREGFTSREFRESLPFLKALRGWLAESP
jgi:DNA-binding MarR family transcriptional regulator